MTRPRIKLPDSAKTGEVIDVKIVVTHMMETGNRRDPDGKPIPRNIIHTFKAAFEGRTVFEAEFGPGISANPFLSFSMRVPGPGSFTFTWLDDSGTTLVETVPLNVTG